MEACIGDWIIYYEPGRLTDARRQDGRRSYFATARVDRIEPDPGRPEHYYAFVSGYLEFPRSVPFREGTHFYESKLGRPDGSVNAGTAQNAVRHLSDAEYDLILQSGIARVISTEHTNERYSEGLAEGEQEAFQRPIVEQVVSRRFRDAAFAGAVKHAYNDTCAMTGIRMINGAGRSEVQAAHIRPVAAEGPDSIRNGLALSGTFHWMFDRGLVSVDDDHRMLVAHARVPDTIGRLLNPTERLWVPTRSDFQPNPRFLKYHREHVFKG